MRLGWLMIAALGLGGGALTGCERKPEPKAEVPAQAVPLIHAEKTPDAEAELTLPDALRGAPALHRRIYDEEVAALRKFAAEAKAERAEVGVPMPPYGLEVTWRVAAETPRLLSLVREESRFTGGAHPNSDSRTLLWDKQAARTLDDQVLFPTAAAHAGIEQAICDGLKREKAERGGAELTGETWACPKWNEITLALAPGGQGRAGGVTALFDPYEVGAYAEGPYEVTLPAAAVRDALAPEFRGEFGG